MSRYRSPVGPHDVSRVQTTSHVNRDYRGEKATAEQAAVAAKTGADLYDPLQAAYNAGMPLPPIR